MLNKDDILFIKAYSRGTSTKTRIETFSRNSITLRIDIQEAHPLKQGLKLSDIDYMSGLIKRLEE